MQVNFKYVIPFDISPGGIPDYLLGAGLGDIICVLSTLIDTGKSISLPYSPLTKTINSFKTIFSIYDSAIKFENFDTPGTDVKDNFTGGIKFFSPYFSPDNIRLHGQTAMVGRKYRPCIGLAITNPAPPPPPEFNIVNYKYYNTDTWNNIIKKIKLAGYDVITFDSYSLSLEQKVYLLNEFCSAVIGYEGGVAHLAHVLKIPTFLLPWHHNSDGTDGGPELFYVAQRLHMDARTWFLESPKEFFSWSKEEFKHKIESLENGQGNNIYLTDQVEVDRTTFKVKTTLPYNLDLKLNDFDQKFLKEHIL